MTTFESPARAHRSRRGLLAIVLVLVPLQLVWFGLAAYGAYHLLARLS